MRIKDINPTCTNKQIKKIYYFGTSKLSIHISLSGSLEGNHRGIVSYHLDAILPGEFFDVVLPWELPWESFLSKDFDADLTDDLRLSFSCRLTVANTHPQVPA